VIALQGYVHTSDGTTLAGVEVCERRCPDGDDDSCVMSGPGGSFTLAGVPANELLFLTFLKDGFVPMLRSVLTGAQDLRLPESENALLAASEPRTFLGIAADPVLGHIAFRIEGAGGETPDLTATLTRVDGSIPPPGASGDWAAAPRTAAGGAGGFVNVPPGMYVLRVGGASSTCAADPLYGLPVTMYQPPGVAALVISVLAGYVTAPLVVSCASVRP
jgi:hypothetical protein